MPLGRPIGSASNEGVSADVVETSVPASGQHRARLGLLVYGAVVALMSAVGLTAYAVTDVQAFGAIALMSPAVGCVVARLVLREGFRDVSWRVGGRRGWIGLAVGVVLPLAVASFSYGIGWATGLTQFDPPGTPLAGSEDLRFLTQVLVAATLGGVLLSVAALGEELGWRGYMLTRLVDAGVPRPVLTGALAWALFHLPLTFLAGYAASDSIAVSVILLTIQITAAGVIIGRLRLSTGSIWPAVVLHGWWNAVVQTAYDPATSGPDHALWVGESGALTTAALVAVAIVVYRRPWVLRRHPHDTPSPLPRP